MTVEEKFRQELVELLIKYSVKLRIEIEQDYAGIQSAEIVFDTQNSCSNSLFKN